MPWEWSGGGEETCDHPDSQCRETYPAAGVKAIFCDACGTEVSREDLS